MEGNSVARAGDLRPVPGGPPGEAIGGDGIGHTGQIAKLVEHEDCNLTISRQCEVLGLHRSTLYYKPIPVRESDAADE